MQRHFSTILGFVAVCEIHYVELSSVERHALTRCFSAIADLLVSVFTHVFTVSSSYDAYILSGTLITLIVCRVCAPRLSACPTLVFATPVKRPLS